jgi:hypothetical protein
LRTSRRQTEARYPVKPFTQVGLNDRKLQTLGEIHLVRAIFGVSCAEASPAANNSSLRDAESHGAARTRRGNAPLRSAAGLEVFPVTRCAKGERVTHTHHCNVGLSYQRIAEASYTRVKLRILAFMAPPPPPRAIPEGGARIDPRRGAGRVSWSSGGGVFAKNSARRR